jgi:indolepyruvate ferredoxin oxidoreductase beta subunit
MEFNLILAGVGGQGILSIAQAISLAALRRGWQVRQSEVHGMAQRGGAVQSHLRIADHPLYSDLIPLGRADLVLSVEPLEALRYVQYLREGGTVVTSTAPFVNTPNYPPVEGVLERISTIGPHVLVDAERFSRAAGSGRAENMVMLGAADFFIELSPEEMEAAIGELFARKGASIIEINRKAFRYGRSAAAAYVDGIRHGGSPRDVRHWITSIAPDHLKEIEQPDLEMIGLIGRGCELSGAEAQAVAQKLDAVLREGRSQLHEHEVYNLVELVGAISPPRHLFIQKGETVTFDQLERFPGERVVLKIVSPGIVHKSDAGGIRFVPNETDAVHREIAELIRRHEQDGAAVSGVLVVEFVEQDHHGFGTELFVGIRAAREFGAIIAAGLGGVDTEYLAGTMKPGRAVAKALAAETTPEEFFELFQKTAAYDVLSGQARGHRRIVSDGELLRCFRSFIAIARRFCVRGDGGGPGLRELEVNPFAFVHHRMIPLDGRGRIGPPHAAAAGRPLDRVQRLLEPQSIAVMGVSGRRQNFGRIILQNIIDCGFPKDRLYIIKDQSEPIDGVPCVASLRRLPEKVDLLVMAASAEHLLDTIADVFDRDHVGSVIVIPGGVGEKEGTEELLGRLRAAIDAGRDTWPDGPVFLGPNCMGVRSRPGRYDTFFIPPEKLDPRRQAKPRRAALISQSGAFIITRMSNLESLDPTIAVSLGNQIDLTVSDLLLAVGRRPDIDCVGVYGEGFNDLDGLAFIRAVETVTAAGKIVVFYKAGRTPAGRSATAGHTASLAGDYDVCQSAVAQAGAIVVDTFKEFEQLMELCTLLHGQRVRGTGVGAVSNAGYETVGMADAIHGARYEIEMPDLCDESKARLRQTLAHHQLDALVNARNPLDLTPMATDAAYEECARVMLRDENIDALVVSCVPLTPRLRTTAEELRLGESLAERIPRLTTESDKPIVFVVDAGPVFDPLARAVRDAGIPVFRTCDQAIRSLGRYLCHRAPTNPPADGAVTEEHTVAPDEIAVGAAPAS